MWSILNFKFMHGIEERQMFNFKALIKNHLVEQMPKLLGHRAFKFAFQHLSHDRCRLLSS